MTDEQDGEIDDILNAYDHQHDERQEQIRQSEEAGALYDSQFRQKIASVIRPYFDEVARRLEAHGHSALVEEGSISSPDHGMDGGSKVTLAFLPKEKARQNLHHQLELNEAPHIMLSCDKEKRVIEFFQDPDPGSWGLGPVFQPTWPIERLTRVNLRARIVPMIREVLSSPS
jgi:hypothetical protein